MTEEHYTTSQAARILARTGRPISERRFRQMLQGGELEGEQSESGRWRILRRALHALMEESLRNSRERNSPGPEEKPGVSAEAAGSPESVRPRSAVFGCYSDFCASKRPIASTATQSMEA
jgi:hypothetical protein